jgi:hypothetical protein
MILMRTDLAVDPRVVRVASITKATKITIIGCLHWLWSMGQTQSTDGFIPLMTLDAIDSEVGVPGFAEAMASIGWLRSREDGVEIPDFDSYFGKSSKTRAKDRLRKSRDRSPKPKPDTTRNKSGHNLEKIPHSAESCAQRIGTDRNGLERNEPTPTPGSPVAVVERHSDGKPEDPKYAALIFAGVGTAKARELAALPYFTLDSIRRVADSWKQQGKHATGALVGAMESAAEKDRIYAARKAAQGAKA